MDSDIAFLAKEIRHAISDPALKQPMFKIDILMFEAIRLDVFSDVRFSELRNIYSQSGVAPGRGYTTVIALHWLAENASRRGFPYSPSLPELPLVSGSVGLPARKLATPHVESLATLLQSLVASKLSQRMTIGELIGKIRGIELDEERGRKRRAQIIKTPTKGSAEEAHFFAALQWEDVARTGRNRVHAEPGADRVMAVCRDEFGDALAETLTRLRDRLSIRLDCEPAKVSAMSLNEFLAAWKGEPLVHEAQKAIKPKGRPKKGQPRITVNLRMLHEMSRNPESENWPLRTWSKHLDCVPSAIAKTPAWKAIVKNRESQKNSRKARTPKRYEQ